MMPLFRSLRRRVLAPILWWARDQEGDALDQSAWSRGRADARRAAADGRVFGLCTAASTVAVPIVVGSGTGSLAVVPRALLTVAAVVVGYLLVPIVWAVLGTITAPVRQRDALRTRLEEFAAEAPDRLAGEFSGWLSGVRASFPAEPSFPHGAIFEQSGGPMRADLEIRRARYADACAEAIRGARVAYHERFRERVTHALGANLEQAIDEPKTLGDLQAIADALAGTGDQRETEPVSASHEQQLRGTLEHLQIRLGQQEQLDFGDPVGSIHLYESAFAAHFPDLLARVQQWNDAVRAVKAAHGDYGAALAAAADALEIEPPTYDRDAILRALSERTRPSLHLALEELSTEAVPVRGYDDGRVEFAGVLTKVPKPIAPVHLQKLVAPLVELCARARALPEVQTIAAAQDTITGLIQPFYDELRLELFVEVIRVAPACPVCQRNTAA